MRNDRCSPDTQVRLLNTSEAVKHKCPQVNPQTAENIASGCCGLQQLLAATFTAACSACSPASNLLCIYIARARHHVYVTRAQPRSPAPHLQSSASWKHASVMVASGSPLFRHATISEPADAPASCESGVITPSRCSSSATPR